MPNPTINPTHNQTNHGFSHVYASLTAKGRATYPKSASKLGLVIRGYLTHVTASYFKAVISTNICFNITIIKFLCHIMFNSKHLSSNS